MASNVTHFALTALDQQGHRVCIGLTCLGYFRDLKPAARRLPVTVAPDAVDCSTCQRLVPGFATVRSAAACCQLSPQERRVFARMQQP